MAKPIGGKKKGENKGVIGSAIDRVLGRKEEPSPGKIVDMNRKTGEDIASALQTVNFSKLKSAEGMTEEKLTEMRASVKALILKIQNAPTIFDDISRLDAILLNAAETLKTAAELCYVNQAEWCINAISNGLLLLRDNVPPHLVEDRDAIIEERVQYMETYQKLITLYGKIDESTKNISANERDLKQYEEEFAPKQQQVKELRTTKEGLEVLSAIKANENQPSNLSDKEKETLLLLTETGSLASRIKLLRDMQYSETQKKQGALDMAGDFRAALDDRPGLYNKNLAAEYQELQDHITESISRTLIEAMEIHRISKEAERKRQAVMDGVAGQELVSNALEVENELTDVKKMSQRQMQAYEELKRQNEQRNQQELKNQNMQVQMETLAQEIENAAIDFNMAEATLTDTDANVQTDTNEQEDLQYNLNS